MVFLFCFKLVTDTYSFLNMPSTRFSTRRALTIPAVNPRMLPYSLSVIFFLVFSRSTSAQSPVEWARETEMAQWRPRDSQGELVFKDQLWILGGWFNSYEAPPRDVWRSHDGKTWSLVTQKAPWIHSDLPMTITYADKMWVMGGWYNGRLKGHSASNQVWSSSDGMNWNLETNSAQWSPRLASAVVEFKGKMWILGGTENYYFGDENSLKNDVWFSSDGVTWELATADAGWPPRAYHQAAVLNGKMYVFGGGNYVPEYAAMNDVWSSEDGVHWTQVSPKAPWHARIWFSSATYRDKLWVMGGWSNNPYKNWSDVWYSSDGINWHELKTNSGWKERHEHATFVFKDKIWIAGGMVPPLTNDVWSLHLPVDWEGEVDSLQNEVSVTHSHAVDQDTSLLSYTNEEGIRRPVTNVAEWSIKRNQILQGMQAAMGPLPDLSVPPPLNIQWRDTLDRSTYIRYTINFTVTENEVQPAYLYVPKLRKKNMKVPAMVVLHGTGEGGKDIVDGQSPRANRAHARELAERGYVVIAPDYPSMGELKDYFDADRYESATMKAIVNHMRCVDLLQTLPMVDDGRIGVIGHSLGGHNAMFLAAFDQRLKVVVSSCGWTLMDYYNAGQKVSQRYGGRLGPWAQDRYMPLLKTKCNLDGNLIPFDFDEIIAAIAPRHFFSNSPVNDSNFDVTGVRKGISNAMEVYRFHGAENNLRVHYPDAGHDFPTDTRLAAYEFVDQALRHKPNKQTLE